MTLVELVVGMALMALFLGLFSVSMTSMYSATSKSVALSRSSSEIALAFNQLDTTVRYATGISAPSQGLSGSWYVEFVSGDPANAICSQLRLAKNPTGTDYLLQLRAWPNGSASTDSWRTIAASLRPIPSADAEIAPFSRIVLSDDAASSGSSEPTMRLQVRLESAITDLAGGASTETKVTFTALNAHSAGAAAICELPGSRP